MSTNSSGNTTLQSSPGDIPAQEPVIIQVEGADPVTIAAPIAAMASQNDTVVAMANSVVINDRPGYTHAAALLRTWKQSAKDLEATRKSLTKPLDMTKKRLMEFFGNPIDAFNRAIATLDSRMVAFALEDERRVLEARKIGESAAAREIKRLENKADRLESKGDTQMSAIVRQQAGLVATPVPVAEVGVRGVPGGAVRKTYSARVVNLLALAKAVAAGDMPVASIEANETFLNAQARSHKEQFKIPGCELVIDYGVTSK